MKLYGQKSAINIRKPRWSTRPSGPKTVLSTEVAFCQAFKPTKIALHVIEPPHEKQKTKKNKKRKSNLSSPVSPGYDNYIPDTTELL